MNPPTVPTIQEVRQAVAAARAAGRRIGLVPTMGALHAGHASLIRACRADSHFTVVSIFVNPTQFGANEDFERYPRTLEADQALCAALGTDLIFAPSAAEMYPPEARTFVEVTELQDVLCGRSRPGHFRGVATVVTKLFQIVQPDSAYFGQKDAQQALIIERLTADLNMPVAIRVLPTIREPDGLALSSRNRYLSPSERHQATCLYQALRAVEDRFAAGERVVAVLEAVMRERIGMASGVRLDYAEIRDARTLAAIPRIERPALAAVAAFLGSTRLIDNTILKPGASDRE